MMMMMMMMMSMSMIIDRGEEEGRIVNTRGDKGS
jgi:hypothetical protein